MFIFMTLYISLIKSQILQLIFDTNEFLRYCSTSNDKHIHEGLVSLCLYAIFNQVNLHYIHILDN